MANQKYVETLEIGSKVFVWSGDVRYSEIVKEMDARYIRTSKSGRFGRKTGKGIDESHMHLASAAGEK